MGKSERSSAFGMSYSSPGRAGARARTSDLDVGRGKAGARDDDRRLINKRKLSELAEQVKPNAEQVVLHPEVAEVLLELAEDFVENVAAFGCRLAKHRKSKVL